MNNAPISSKARNAIINLLKTTSTSARGIGRQVGVSETTVARIQARMRIARPGGLPPTPPPERPALHEPTLPVVILDGRGVIAAPTELDNRIADADAAAFLRELYCQHYDACLNVAAHHNWQSFSCQECPLRGRCTVAKDRADGWFRRSEMVEVKS